MKINPGAYNVGKPRNLRVGENDHPTRQVAPGKSEENTDKILISSEGAQRAETDTLVRSVMSHIECPADPDRIATLKAAVASGNYQVATGDLVDALLQRWMGG